MCSVAAFSAIAAVKCAGGDRDGRCWDILVMTPTRLEDDPQLVSPGFAGSDIAELSRRVLYLHSERCRGREMMPVIVAQLWQRALNVDAGHVLEPQLPIVSDVFAGRFAIGGP